MFHDRESAARQLAELLAELALEDPLVLGIPRGGAITAAGIADYLQADLDVVLARKLRAPQQREFALGAIGEDGRIYLKRDVQALPGVDRAYLQKERDRCLHEIQRQRQVYRQHAEPLEVSGRCVVLVDDGVATGATLFAALEVVRAQHARQVVVAVPVAPPDTLVLLRRSCDQVCCLLAPADFRAVGQYYEAFPEVSDEQVIEALEVNRRLSRQWSKR